MSSTWNHLKLSAYSISHTMYAETDDEIKSSMEGGMIKLTPKVKKYIMRLEESSKINSSIFFTKKETIEPEHIINEMSDSGQLTLLKGPESTNKIDGQIDNQIESQDLDQLNDLADEEKEDNEEVINEITYSTRYLLKQICLFEEYDLIEELPLNLIKSIDKRINDGLLLILISEDQEDVVSRRIIIWYLPLSEGGFRLFEERDGYMIDTVSKLYIDTGKKFKAVALEGNFRRDFTDQKVSDNSVSGSRYWVETFLGASFELDSPQIQKKIAKSMKKLASSPVQPKELNQRNEDGLVMPDDDGWEPAFDFGSALDSINDLDDEEDITIDRFVEEYVPEPQKEKFTKSFPEEVRQVPFKAKSTKETFQQQFKRKKIRAILSDNSVIEIIGTREDIEKHLKVDKSNNKVTFTLEATETIEDLMR